MPPADPRLCPALERALPGDDLPAGDPAARYRGEIPPGAPWEMLFGDGLWHWVSVRAWRLDRFGRRVVQVEWHAGGSTWSGEFIAADEMMREFEG